MSKPNWVPKAAQMPTFVRLHAMHPSISFLNFWHADAALSFPLGCKHLKHKHDPSLCTPSFSFPCKQHGANKPLLGKPPQQLGTLWRRGEGVLGALLHRSRPTESQVGKLPMVSRLQPSELLHRSYIFCLIVFR